MQIWPFFPFMKRPLFPKQERFYWDLWQAKRALQNEKCSAMSAVGPLELLSSVSCCVQQLASHHSQHKNRSARLFFDFDVFFAINSDFVGRKHKAMTTPQIEVVTEAIRCELGEGPHWCPKEQVLYYVDILQGRVLRYDPENRQCHYVTVRIGN